MNKGDVKGWATMIGIGMLVIVVLFAVVSLVGMGSQMFYFMSVVEQQEVGVRFRNGSIYEVVGPGVYSDFGWYVKIERVSSQAVSFSVEDAEIITKDKQRIGVVVSGDIFRPNLAQKDIMLRLWPQYAPMYLHDENLSRQVDNLARQAMKVCVGQRSFDDNIIGDARDALRACIDDELSGMAESYGLQIENVVVPQVILSDAVQAMLDQIVQSRLETEKARQDQQRAQAQALAEQARQEGEIRVAQSRIQEETRQQTTLAQLEQEKLAAQQAVIEAQKANELLAAQQDLAINQARALAAAEKAKAELAMQLAEAEMYARNPGYLQLKMIQANAAAIQATDKLIFVPQGTTPTVVVSGKELAPAIVTNP